MTGMGFLALPPSPFARRAKLSGEYEAVSFSPVPSTASCSSWDSDDSELALLDSIDESDARHAAERIPPPLRDLAVLVPLLIFVAGVTTMFIAFPFPTTIHAFIPLALALASWVAISWLKIGWGALRRGHASKSVTDVLASPGMVVGRARKRSLTHFVLLAGCTVLIGFFLSLGLVPPKQYIPALAPPDANPRYFIAANLYNNERLMPRWTREVLKLVEHLGPERTFVSIYESNSEDETPELLKEFGQQLKEAGVQNRIISEVTGRWWPYNTSPERIELLAAARNRALEPLQSPDPNVRIPNYDQFTKVVFLNDVFFTWDAAVRLLATNLNGDTHGEDGYDLACGTDFAISGLYDTWVARDICGTPLRFFWPFVKDPVSIKRLRENRPFEVSACWNGIVAFKAEPVLYRPSEAELAAQHGSDLNKRGWKMIDNATYPNSQMSPALQTPLQFRKSGIDACDHSECFLFSYDLHRLYPTRERPPRIIMNPDVRVTYVKHWWSWHNVVLRIPVVEWWLYHWSHGFPNSMVDWIAEFFMRRRDYCTWAALEPHIPDRCPPLPGAVNRSWEE